MLLYFSAMGFGFPVAPRFNTSQSQEASHLPVLPYTVAAEYSKSLDVWCI